MVVKGYAAALSGVEGVVVSVEACAMPFQSEIAMTSVIGLPDHSVKESLYRCESAIMQTCLRQIYAKKVRDMTCPLPLLCLQ
jgi:predicted ATPase with chaperone activity